MRARPAKRGWPLPSRAISHARGHLHVSRFADGLQKKERLLVVYKKCDLFDFDKSIFLPVFNPGNACSPFLFLK